MGLAASLWKRRKRQNGVTDVLAVVGCDGNILSATGSTATAGMAGGKLDATRRRVSQLYGYSRWLAEDDRRTAVEMAVTEGVRISVVNIAGSIAAG